MADGSILVTFIVPVYNGEKYLENCIWSIQNQSYSFIQIILVDDGSTDHTWDICCKMAEKDERILLKRQENQGVSCARNLGLQYAQGEWIAFVDADDTVTEDYVRIFLPYLENEEIDICFGEERSSQNPKTVNLQKEDLIQYARGLLNKYQVKDRPHLTSACSKLYRKSLLDRYAMIFQAGLKKSEDALFNQNYFLQAKRGIYIKKKIYNYCSVATSASQKYDPDTVEGYRMYLDLLEKLLRRQGIYDKFQDDYQVRVVFQFFYCIMTQFCHIDNPGRYGDRKKDFLQERSQMPFAKAFEQVKPKKFSAAEKTLFYLVKYNAFVLINFVCRMYSWGKKRKFA